MVTISKSRETLISESFKMQPEKHNGWPIKNDGLSISSIFIAQTSAFFKKMRHLILYEYV